MERQKRNSGEGESRYQHDESKKKGEDEKKRRKITRD